MKILKFLIALFALVNLIGCYEGHIKKAYQELKIGGAKVEIDRLFNKFKLLKEQTVLLYHPDSTEKEMKSSFWRDNTYEDIQPSKKEVITALTFDGNTKVYSYLIDTESNWPNNEIIYYVAIFYDQKNDKVIGKAVMRTTIAIHNWEDKF